ncbi:MAG: SEC-C domain-containing protein [Candidatus Omnitrophica bacterium]|nr:SEC-C domain-containing protein [Candidatus Omnitrophota bacterium]
MIEFSSKSMEWFREYQPKLKIYIDNGRFKNLTGFLNVDMSYSEDDGYVIFPDESQPTRGIHLVDTYQIRVEHFNNEDIPKVYEIGNRIISHAEKVNKPIRDLHINNSDGNVCLCPKPEESIKLPINYNLEDFFMKLVIPFFYAQIFFEKYNRWPWGEYSHGDVGILECYGRCISQSEDKKAFTEDTIKSLNFENQKKIQSLDKISRQSVCWCGSGEKFRKCHHEAWLNLKMLKEFR